MPDIDSVVTMKPEPLYALTASGGGRVELPVMPWIAWGEPINLVVRHETVDRDRRGVTYNAGVRFFAAPRRPTPDLEVGNLDDMLDGDSYVALQPEESPIRTVTLNGTDYHLRLRGNANGRLASCTIDLPPIMSMTDALSVVRSVVNFFVWENAFLTKVPLEYDFLFVRSEDQREFIIGFTPSMPVSRPVVSRDLEVHPSVRPFISLFVEGLRNSSPFYRFLCFFKICQRVNSRVRPQFRKLAIHHGLTPAELNGEFPKDPIEKFDPAMVGTRYTVAISRYQGEYRNAIAHFDPADRLEPFNIAVEGRVRTAAALMAWAANDLIVQIVEATKMMLANGVAPDAIDFG
jgi:hypothetical protein